MTSLENHIASLQNHLNDLRFPETPMNLYDPLRYFMTLGGKRLRPVLTTISAEMLGATQEEALPAALTIELFHNFSLIHDDIMDEAPDRRGKPTVHTKWNRDIAILSGDVLLVEAYDQLCVYNDARLPILLKRFNQTAKEVCEGQQMDMDFEAQDTVLESDYIEMIRLKTSVLLGCSLEFGAIVAHASKEVRDELYQFGVEMGIGFQIQDDILDLYADPDKFGKQVGGDIIANKKTLLFINASELARDSFQQEFIDLLAIEDNLIKVKTAQQLFLKLGSLETTKSTMESYYSKAMGRLKNIQQMGYDTSLLEAFANNLMVREF